MSEAKEAETTDGTGSMHSSGIQVISRAAAIFRALSDSEQGMSLGQIARKVGLPRSTVQRIVAALEHENLLTHAKSSGQVRLGPEIQKLARSANRDIRPTLRPFLEKLCKDTGETVDLAHFRGDHVVFVDQVPGGQRLRAVSAIGERFPLASTANGKACVALLSDADARQHLPASEIIAVRENGYALDLDEHTDGISAIGFAFALPAGDIYAISVPTPSHRFAARREMLISHLLAAKEAVLTELDANVGG